MIFYLNITSLKMMTMKHKPVLLDEVLTALNIKENGIYLDLTLGGGGHSFEILKQLNHSGFLFAFDQDLVAIKQANTKLKDFKNYKIFHTNFKFVTKYLNSENISEVDGILLDLGMSSFQIDDSQRGFSYMREGPLDMRMNTSNPLTVKAILNTYSLEQLTTIFKNYGQEPNSYKIAQQIIKNRPLSTTTDLVKITDLFPSKGHSAKRVFQALRIYLNDELTALKEVLPQAFSLLKQDGVLAIISFHSLEDKIVKEFFKEKVEERVIKGLPTLPEKMPMRYYRKKRIKPSATEIEKNPRASSAILRVALKN